MADGNARRSGKLPFWKTVGRAYWAFFANPIQIFKSAWLWVVALFAVGFLSEWALWPAEGTAQESVASGNSEHSWSEFFDTLYWVWFYTVNLLITVLLVASLAVAWHRLILRGETMRFSYYARLDRLVWYYGGIGLLLTLAVAFLLTVLTPFVVFIGVAIQEQSFYSTQRAAELSIAMAGVLFLIVCLIMLARLSLILPAFAIGQRAIGFGSIWRATKGNSLRIFAGWLICGLAMMLTEMIYLIVGLGVFDRTEHALFSGFYNAIVAVTAFPTVSFLSYAFGHFFPAPENGDVQHGK